MIQFVDYGAVFLSRFRKLIDGGKFFCFPHNFFCNGTGVITVIAFGIFLCFGRSIYKFDIIFMYELSFAAAEQFVLFLADARFLLL